MTNTSSTENIELLAESPLALIGYALILLVCAAATAWGFRAFVGRVSAVCAGVLVIVISLAAILEDMMGLCLALLALSLLALAAPWLGPGREEPLRVPRPMRIASGAMKSEAVRWRMVLARGRDLPDLPELPEDACEEDKRRAAREYVELLTKRDSVAEDTGGDTAGDIAEPHEWDGDRELKGRNKA